MANTDLYAILGCDHTATQDDLKKSYRKLARELHPDARPGDPASEARFKEVSQAYEILSDPERRANYDRFGVDGPGGNFGSGSVQDIFDLFFGAMNANGSRRRGPQPGPDAEIVIDLTLEDAAFGVSRDLPVTLAVHCETCGGRGAAPGTSPSSCAECHGAGEVRRVRNSFLGQMMTTQPCLACQGTGETISTPCPTCRGDGRQNAARTLKVDIPAGIEHGSTMRLTGRGPVGPRGGPSGTLYVHLRVQPDARFERVGDDLHHEVHVAFTQAALGTTVEVPILKGTHTIEVDPGSQPGTVFTLRHEGVHHLHGRGRGDLFVHLAVDVPTTLDDTAESLLRQLAEHNGDDVAEGGRGLFFAPPWSKTVSGTLFARRVDALGQFRVLDPENPRLNDADAHHLWRVLRAREGEEIVVSDGRGTWSFAKVGTGSLERCADVYVDEPTPPVSLYLAPLKAERSEWAVAKATELGVTSITPLLSARVVVKNRGMALEKMVAKWRRVADAAVGQCRRSFDVEVTAPCVPADVPAHVAVADFGGDSDLLDVAAIAVGPEGGWGDEEWGQDRRFVGLGTTVLRGDTAAVVAATLLVQAREGWSRHSGPRPVDNDEETR